MNITNIEISNIKGISHRFFKFELLPNKPNILVAPNGFGKSSFAIAFDSLKQSKIQLEDNHYYLNNQDNRPRLAITLSNGNSLIADDKSNTISEHFDIFVINNQTEPKSVVQSFGGKTFARTSLNIVPTTLVQTIPKKLEFDYSSSTLKSSFGNNGKRLLTNIENLFSCAQLFHRIESEIDFTRFELKHFQTVLSDSILKINERNGTGKEIKKWVEQNILPLYHDIVEFEKFSKIIQSFGFPEIADEVDSFFTAWQIITVRNSMGTDFKKACKYLYYLDEKEHYTSTIDSFNPVKERFDLKPKPENNSLVVNWPKAHEISNGQRDILTFIALLFRAKRNFKKNDCILIIDEIFDYLDDANLVSFQYYVSTFIDEMKRQKRRIFPILLTHLDPLFFNHFCFDDNKIKVHYLKEINVKSNQHILKIIYKRDDMKIKDMVDAYFFHYHPSIQNIDLRTEFQDLKLNTDWSKPENFLKKIFREVRRYLLETDAFDPLAICFGVRIKIEQLVFDKILDAENKRIFIEEVNGTKNKLHYAQSIGVDVPETYFLLGIIYNTSLHLSEGQDISQPLGLKLENNTIKQMILNLFNSK